MGMSEDGSDKGFIMWMRGGFRVAQILSNIDTDDTENWYSATRVYFCIVGDADHSTAVSVEANKLGTQL
jgi:hypothetical protein